MKSKMRVDRRKCLKCGGCVSVCPKNANELLEEGIVFYDYCINCRVCEKFCPVGAIKYEG
ncbi:MAG: 4Fe-4S binding protein [archaeon]